MGVRARSARGARGRRAPHPTPLAMVSPLRNVAVLLALALPAAARALGAPLTAQDLAAIRALDSAFVSAWLRDDTTAVLSLFVDDAVLMPPGARPVSGRQAIRAWWWPSDGSRTRILSFGRAVDEIGGTRELAFVRATSTLRWSTTRGGTSSTQASRSADLWLVARGPDGRWRIVRQMWNVLP
jgi:uncharacterized protein (TIGR02246 family)